MHECVRACAHLPQPRAFIHIDAAVWVDDMIDGTRSRYQEFMNWTVAAMFPDTLCQRYGWLVGWSAVFVCACMHTCIYAHVAW